MRATGKHPDALVREHLAHHRPRLSRLRGEAREREVERIEMAALGEVMQVVAGQAVNDARKADAYAKAGKSKR